MAFLNLIVCKINENSSFIDVVDVEIGTTHLVLLKQKNATNVITPFLLRILLNSLKYVLFKERLEL
jgi:hypothetical protein